MSFSKLIIYPLIVCVCVSRFTIFSFSNLNLGLVGTNRQLYLKWSQPFKILISSSIFVILLHLDCRGYKATEIHARSTKLVFEEIAESALLTVSSIVK